MNRRDFLTIGSPIPRFADRGDGALQQTPVFARRSATGLEPHTGGWSYREAAHLLRRCMVGPTDAEIRKAVADGLEVTLTNLLKSFSPSIDDIDDWAGQDPQVRPVDASQQQAFIDAALQRRGALVRWWHKTIATSPVSIQERMTFFWHNHFTSEMEVVQLAEFMYGQNQLLRRNMLGNFKQLVKDVTKDMAMLIYLDGAKSFKTGSRNQINENYARELLELFTMGVNDWDGNPNYTQNDVSEAARALTGYTLTPSSKGAAYIGLNSMFTAIRWDSGDKTIFGKTGKWKADDVVDIIFTERADQTAKFICEKLYRAFVYDVADPVVVTAMAETLRQNNWEIRPVVEQLLRSAHFFDVTNIGAMDKSPIDYMLGMIRGMGLTNIPDFNPGQPARTARDLAGRLTALGQTLLDPPNVKGWPGGRTWISTSTLPLRQKFAIDVAGGKVMVQNRAYYLIDPIAFAKLFPDHDDIHKLSENISLFLLNTPPSAKEAETIYDVLLDNGKDYEWNIDDPEQKPADRIRKYLAAVFQLPKYQLY